MNKERPPYHFKNIKQKYQWLMGLEVVLWTLAIGLFTLYLLKAFVPSPVVSVFIASMAGTLAFFIRSRQLKLFTIKENDLAKYLNRHYPALQESVDLLLKHDDEISPLQQLQKEKTIQRLEEIYPTIRIPHHLGQAGSVFAISIVVSIILTSFSPNTEKKETYTTADIPSEVKTENLPGSIKVAKITVNPPAYTNIKSSLSPDFNLQIPEGSKVRWELQSEGQVTNQKMVFSAKDSILLSGNNHTVEKTFSTSGFYQFTWINSNGEPRSSDYYKIDVIKDRPPTIAVENLNQFLELSQTDNLAIGVKATITDDYGLQQASIIATVSKGSGEGIKFREEKLSFETPQKISGKKLQALKSLDLLKLGLQPGDELYFYIEAEDNKTPIANRSRTETYFITLQDTSSVTTSIDAGFGVDLMPEYFRSQRQIIIDTEKLLRTEKEITKQNFNSRSNELAHDQKVLRLRYGEFLGEEFESSIGPQASSPEANEHEDIQKRFGHSHDTDNEHNLVQEKSGEDHAHADHKAPDGNQKSDPLKEFVHAHDGEEEATFFVQSIRAKLKAAVTIMWDAELHLRLYEPEKSLPYQYKALKLLKEISQDSRIYVHRTGFDPPPLKEEKRLTADLHEIQNSISNIQRKNQEEYPNIGASLLVLEKLLRDDYPVITADVKNILTKAGQEVAQVELKQPGKYLKTLSWLRMITENKVSEETFKQLLSNIRNSFWKILPEKNVNPQPRSGVTHELDLEFLKNLEASSMKNN